ncbi:MAG TPA: hypothetical protein PLO63_12570 [Syntrophales bacterium]|jgi:hypothetical protein|nr:hypothetical protein [Syntrophales bacterium]
MMMETGIVGVKTRGREEFSPRQSLLCMNVRRPVRVPGLLERLPVVAPLKS